MSKATSGGRGTLEAQRSRQEAVARLVLDSGSLPVEVLAKTMGVSTMTIYRDVATLEEQGLVTLLKGSVFALASTLNEASAEFRMGENSAIKERFALAVDPLIPVRATVMLDDSTSAIYAVVQLAGQRPLNVITNSLLAARQLEPLPDVQLQIIGGEYQKWAQASVGSAALKQIRDLHADICIVSTSGIAAGGCFHPYRELADVKQAMLAASESKMLLADGSKFSRRSVHRFADLADFDYLVTDESAPAEALAELRGLPGQLITVAAD
ncbi:DeoR/GlpR family DNA-binding transcription regulator [Scrofimicrobium sp. R131]|uniref:Lactose phosphotransferase system repressor n=1 Tax=Scrofimicrobium appendicitidis TaxID=3079930 RepID=A0AAU7V4U1_9ACTO